MYRKSLLLVAVCAVAAFLGGAVAQWAFGAHEAKGAGNPEEKALVVNCTELRLVDAKGRLVACLSSDGKGIHIPSGTDADTPGLFFFDTAGKPRAMFGLSGGGPGGFPNIYFYNKDDTQGFAVVGEAMAFSIDKVCLWGGAGGSIKVRDAAKKIIFATP